MSDAFGSVGHQSRSVQGRTTEVAKGRKMLGRISPGRIWESGPVRSVRRPLARSISQARARSTARRRERAIIEDARADAERILADHADRLAGGSWRLMLHRKVKFGKPLVTMQRGVGLILVHESIGDSRALGLGLPGAGRDPTVHPYVEAWTDSQEIALPHSGETTGADFVATVVLPRHSEKSLHFDLRRKKVLRYSEAPFTSEYERLRRVFSHHVPSVPFEVLPGRHRLVESLAPGTPLSDIDAAAQLQVVADLLDHLAELAGMAGEGDSIELLTSAVATLDQGSSIDEQHETLVAYLGSSVLVPSHGDLVGGNILVSQGRPVVIDFGALAQRPAWYDGVLLVSTTANEWRRRSGKGDPVELDSLLYDFLRRTVRVPPPEDWRRLVDLGYTLIGGLDLHLR